MSKEFIVVRMGAGGAGDSYQTLGPWTEGYTSFLEADAGAQALSLRYPLGCFALFQRKIVYNSSHGTNRIPDRKARKPKTNITEFTMVNRSIRAY